MATTVDSLERGRLHDGIEGHHIKISTNSERAACNGFRIGGAGSLEHCAHADTLRILNSSAQRDPGGALCPGGGGLWALALKNA